MTEIGDRPVRSVERVAGLCSGGLVAIGLVLVVLQLLAPDLAPGTGLGAATGPGWGRAGAQLGVGAAGELLVWRRRSLPRAARVWLAVAVIVATAAALWWCWWR